MPYIFSNVFLKNQNSVHKIASNIIANGIFVSLSGSSACHNAKHFQFTFAFTHYVKSLKESCKLNNVGRHITNCIYFHLYCFIGRRFDMVDGVSD